MLKGKELGSLRTYNNICYNTHGRGRIAVVQEVSLEGMMLELRSERRVGGLPWWCSG